MRSLLFLASILSSSVCCASKDFYNIVVSVEIEHPEHEKLQGLEMKFNSNRVHEVESHSFQEWRADVERAISNVLDEME